MFGEAVVGATGDAGGVVEQGGDQSGVAVVAYGVSDGRVHGAAGGVAHEGQGQRESWLLIAVCRRSAAHQPPLASESP